MSERPSLFQPGHRVEIVGDSHVWVGHTGHIFSPFIDARFPHADWVVELEEPAGQRTVVSSIEIRSRPRGI